MYSKLLLGIATLIGLGISPSARADLIFFGAVDLQGTGLGAVDTILTLKSPNNTSIEAGGITYLCTTPTSCTDPETGNTITGTNDVRPIGTLIDNNQARLGIVFNPIEPGNDAKNGITLNSLTLSIYQADGDPAIPTNGTLLFTTTYAPTGGQFFSETDLGNGKSGFLYVLDAAQSLQIFKDIRIGAGDVVGLSAIINNAEGGHDTFFKYNVAGGVPVPEPASLALFGTGVIGLAAVLKRRRRRGGGACD